MHRVLSQAEMVKEAFLKEAVLKLNFARHMGLSQAITVGKLF